MNYEFITLMVAIIVGIGSISTSILVALGGIKKSQIESITKMCQALEEKNQILQKRVDDLESINEQLKKERENSRQIRQQAENELFVSFEEKIRLLTETSNTLRQENIELRETTEKLQKDLNIAIDHRKERDEQILILQKKIEEMQKILTGRDCQIEIMATQIENLQKGK